ncbi:MAG: hypothetical protein ACE5K4_11750, partial [Candidatus Hydrothermarchaeota archaeon]
MLKKAFAILIATMMATSGMAFAQDTNNDQSLLERLLNKIDVLIEKIDRLIELLEVQQSQPPRDGDRHIKIDSLREKYEEGKITGSEYREKIRDLCAKGAISREVCADLILDSLRKDFKSGKITLDEYTNEINELAMSGLISNERANDILNQTTTSEEVKLTEAQEAAISGYLSARGITNYTIKEAELEHKDGITVLEVEILIDGQEIELYLDVDKNEVLMHEAESRHVVGTPGEINIEIKDRKVDDIIEELSARGIEIPSSLKNLDPETVLKEFKYHGKNGNVEIKYKLESGEEYKSKSTEGEKIDIEIKDRKVDDIIEELSAR